MPRGGTSPRAGAPRGNRNAWVTDAYSRRYGDALRLIAAIPGLLLYYQTVNDPSDGAARGTPSPSSPVRNAPPLRPSREGGRGRGKGHPVSACR